MLIDAVLKNVVFYALVITKNMSILDIFIVYSTA